MNVKLKFVSVLGIVLCLISCSRDGDNMDVSKEIEQQKVEQFLLSKGFVKSDRVDANAKNITTLEEAKKMMEEIEKFEKMNFIQNVEEENIFEESNFQELSVIYRSYTHDDGQRCVQPRQGYSWTFDRSFFSRASLFSYWNLFIYRGEGGRMEELSIKPSGIMVGWQMINERYLSYSRSIGNEQGAVISRAIFNIDILGAGFRKEYRYVFHYYINGCSATLRTSEF